MSELEEAMRVQVAAIREQNDRRSDEARQSERRLREFRDLLLSKGVQSDQAYSQDLQRTYVETEHRMFGKSVPAHNQYIFDFKPAARGWVLSDTLSDTGYTVGEFLTENLIIHRYSSSTIPVPESKIQYLGLTNRDLLPSAYFRPERVVLVLGEQLTGVHRWGDSAGLVRLADIVRRYLA
ncbi:hypothetical protein GCM10023063_19130 [Arthrobacter methylotrophus]|uniref:Uncharacterized protein n=1 Tax=Arthrobacter methylotrophus TaxID=121291 RepID=A0ABV5UP67_9MICC